MASISLKYKSKQGNLTAPGDVDPGAMIPIATVTVGSGGSSSITFSSIPSTYKHLQIRVGALTTSTVAALFFRFNSDSTNTYYNHELFGEGTSTAANSRTPRTGCIIESAGFPGTTTSPGLIVFDILDYTNTNKYKTTRSLNGYDANGSGYIYLQSSAWPSTSAITQIDIVPNAGTINQYSSFALYGIKEAGA